MRGWVARLVCSFVLWFSFNLFPQEEMVIKSGEAEYNGEEICLTGEVQIQHELGSLYARKIRLLPSQKGQKVKFSRLQLEEEVRIRFKDGGELRCQYADLNYENLHGLFIGSEAHPDVVYNQVLKEKETEEPYILALKSLQMELQLKLLSGDTKKPVVGIDFIQAADNVRLYYKDIYCALADKAKLHKRSIGGSFLEDSQVILYSSAQKPCQISNAQGDRIFASEISLDTKEQTLIFHDPNGHLQMGRDCKNGRDFKISAKKLVWYEVAGVLQLQGAVSLEQEGSVKLETENEVRLYRKKEQAYAKDIDVIIADQETRITFKDPLKGLSHQLMCYGPITIDREKGVMVLQSFTNEKGLVDEDKQACLENLMGEAYADAMQLTYKEDNGSIQLLQLMLLGHVRIFNRFNGHLEESGLVLQYALADQVDYDFQGQEIVLKGEGKSRVLFYDRVNHVQMSAPALKVKHLEESGKESIQGIGDVRFVFMDKELQELRQRFGLEAKAP